MKIFHVLIAGTIAGLLLGAALARLEVGVVDSRLAPPSPDPTAEVGPGVAPAAPEAEELPRVEIDETTFNFGVLQRGSTSSHEFVVKNTGDAPLWLEIGSTSCKCTLGMASEEAIPPGGSAPVKLEWVAKSLPGRFEQRATVHTTDPRRPVIELNVEGMIVEQSALQPREFAMGKLTSDDSRSLSIYLASFVEEGLEATAAMAKETQKPELFEVSVVQAPLEEVPLEGAKSGVRIDLKAGPGFPVGYVAEWLEIKTNQPQIGTVLAPISGIVEGEVTLHGRNWSGNLGILNLGKVKNDSETKERLVVSFKGESAASAEASETTRSALSFRSREKAQPAPRRASRA